MTHRVTRRTFLALAAGATAPGLGARSSPSDSCETAGLQAGCRLPEPAQAPFDTVVVAESDGAVCRSSAPAIVRARSRSQLRANVQDD
jgi:hypothetical protein